MRYTSFGLKITLYDDRVVDSQLIYRGQEIYLEEAMRLLYDAITAASDEELVFFGTFITRKYLIKEIDFNGTLYFSSDDKEAPGSDNEERRGNALL
jgi:hypothetical protein